MSNTKNRFTLCKALHNVSHIHGLMALGFITADELEQIPADRLADFILKGADVISHNPDDNVLGFITSRRESTE